MSDISSCKIAIIGLGVMGQSILDGIIASGQVPAKNLVATTINEQFEVAQQRNPNVSITADNSDAIEWADFIIFCLKPIVLQEFIQHAELVPFYNQTGKTFVSIAAGVTLDDLRKYIKAPANLLRVMPNIAASVQKSTTVICPASNCSLESKQLCIELFSTSGLCRELPESLFDVTTAICGSGPAFFCTIVEGLAAGATKMGLPPALAIELVTQTMSGTAGMILKSGDHPAVLRDRVTTPAGCTVDGLAAMEEGSIRSILAQTIEKCSLKSASMNKK